MINMISKKIFSFFFRVFYLALVFLFISCGKEDKEHAQSNDSTKSDISASYGKTDTANVTTENKPITKEKAVPKEDSKNKKDTSIVKKDKIKIIAYYFHPTARCPSCINIENFTKEVVETLFSKESKAGLISFKQLNIEDSLNEHYIEDYKLDVSSVILAKFVNNKQVKWKNLEHVWKFSGEKENFFKYMKIEVKQFLKDKEEVL
jgi:hypothetical protein